MSQTAAESFRERIAWIQSELRSQLDPQPGVDLVIQDDVATLTFDGTTLVLTPEGQGAEGRLLLTGPDGARRFVWSDSVSIWFEEGTGVLLHDAMRQVMPDSIALLPARVLAVDDVRTYFHTEDAVIKAVDGLDVAIEPGRTLGLVGESGSGKSVTSLTVMGLLPDFSARIPTGRVAFLGQDLLAISKQELAKLRGDDIAMIFQEPMTSLNPVYRVGDQVAEAIVLHQKVSKAEAMKRTIELFDEVGIPDPADRVRSYPHEMSGGQKQRVMIAMALSCNPRLLIADEPTTALDVTIQKQILDLLRNLRDTRGMSILFITHDLGVIAEIADSVAVMYRGKLVEYGEVLQVFKSPAHPYTRGLLACRPRLDSPYRLLPTVSDFLETAVEGGEVVVREKPLDPTLEDRLCNGARPKMPVGEGEPVLSVKDLKVWFTSKKSFTGTALAHIKAVDGVSFDVFRGQTLGLVGESGCGKTTTGRAILGLVPIRSGKVVFEGQDLGFLSGVGTSTSKVAPSILDRIFRVQVGSIILQMEWFYAGAVLCLGALQAATGIWLGMSGVAGIAVMAMALVGAVSILGLAMSRIPAPEADVRRNLQIIFQDPYSSLNPRLTIGDAITEPMKVHGIGDSQEDRTKIAGDLLEEVGLERAYLRRFPHEFSGGQRQRICIARTLALEPSMIICDESVSALDVSVQAQVLNLLKELQIKRGLTYIFISHDLSVVKFMSDVMCVMRDGIIVEAGPADDIYANASEEYTRRLIGAIPNDDIEHIADLQRQRREAWQARLQDAMAAAG
ncbi:MAG: ABC transporter ATP-binding protein [Myxococcota bacterium]